MTILTSFCSAQPRSFRRKLLPALMHLDFSGLLAPDLRILALSREDMSTEQFMAGQEQTLKAYLGEQRWSPELGRFCGRVDYVPCSLLMSANTPRYPSASRLSGLLFFTATPPSLFQTICENLSGSGCLTERSRVVLESPSDEPRELQGSKPTVDFSKRVGFIVLTTISAKKRCRTCWRCVLPTGSSMPNGTIPVSIVQITVAETVGIDGRFPYYDKSGNCETCCKIT